MRCGITLTIKTEMRREDPEQINMQWCTVTNPRNQNNESPFDLYHISCLLFFLYLYLYLSIYLSSLLEKCRLNDIKINFNFHFFELLFPLTLYFSLFCFCFCINVPFSSFFIISFLSMYVLNVYSVHIFCVELKCNFIFSQCVCAVLSCKY